MSARWRDTLIPSNRQRHPQRHVILRCQRCHHLLVALALLQVAATSQSAKSAGDGQHGHVAGDRLFKIQQFVVAGEVGVKQRYQDSGRRKRR